MTIQAAAAAAPAGSSSTSGGAAAGGSASTLLGTDAAAAGAAGGAPAAGAAAGAAGAAGAGDAGKGAADAAAAKAAAEAAAAAELVIKLPDGFKEDASFGSFKELAKKYGLKSEAAQGIVDLYAQAQKQQAQEQQDAIAQQAKDWEGELKADKDFGGAKYEQNVQDARKAVQAFGGDELRKFFAEHPLGSHPLLVKALAKAGRALGEGKLVGTGTEGAALPTNNKIAFHQSMYPNSYEKMQRR